jgi:hypothetical protein
MPHMFRIEYVTNHASGQVETGKILVVAESHEQAHDLTCQFYNLPPTRTRFVVSDKVRPPIIRIDTNQYYPNTRVSVRSARERELAPIQRHQVTVQASNVSGQNEQQAIKKVSEELWARAKQSQLPHHLQMSVDCEIVAEKTSPPSTLEKIEMFGARPGGRVQGGKTQGK